jgi:phage major head subunit gpT-like protein
MLRTNSVKLFFSNALPALEALIYNEYEQHPDAIPSIFNVEGMTGWGTQDLTYAGLQATQQVEEGEEAAQDMPIEGYTKTYTAVEYALTVSFSKTYVDDDRWNVVSDTYKDLGMSSFQCKQIVAINVLNDAFTATGPDSTTLFSTAHTMVGGASVANRPSSEIALSVGGLQAMQTAMRRQVNHRNLNVYLMPQTIVIPPELEQTAFELDNSQGRPDLIERADNAYKGRYKWIITPYLTSTTAWFALANKHYLKLKNRQAPATESWFDKPTRMISTMTSQRFDVGYSDHVGTWGTTGA